MSSPSGAWFLHLCMYVNAITDVRGKTQKFALRYENISGVQMRCSRVLTLSCFLRFDIGLARGSDSCEKHFTQRPLSHTHRHPRPPVISMHARSISLKVKWGKWSWKVKTRSHQMSSSPKNEWKKCKMHQKVKNQSGWLKVKKRKKEKKREYEGCTWGMYMRDVCEKLASQPLCTTNTFHLRKW